MPKTQSVFIPSDLIGPKLKSFMIFWQTCRKVTKCIDSFLLRNSDISIIHLVVLKILDYNNGTMKPSEIALWTNTKRHNVTTLIQRMEKLGLIRIERDNRNRRNVNVILTKKGQSSMKKTISLAKQAVDNVMLSITKRDGIKLEQLMQLMIKNTTRLTNKIT